MATKKKLSATKKLSSFPRLDYAGNGRGYMGLKEDVDKGLPTDGYDGDKFLCVDSSELYILYKDTWYKQK